MQLWEFEPNNLKFKYNDYLIEIVRNSKFGFLCGYILIPSNNIFYGMKYDEILSIINFKYELTYSDYDGQYWKIGFDGGSSKDYIPNQEILGDDFNELYISLGLPIPTPDEYKNIESMALIAKEICILLDNTIITQ